MISTDEDKPNQEETSGFAFDLRDADYNLHDLTSMICFRL